MPKSYSSVTAIVLPLALLLLNTSVEARSSLLESAVRTLQIFFIDQLMDALFFDTGFESAREPGYTRSGYGQGGTKCRESSTHLGDTKEFIGPNQS